MRQLISLTALVALPLSTAGCPRPIGACQYDEARVERGTVRIVSVEPVEEGSRPTVQVRTTGLFSRTLSYPAEEFQRCFTDAGYQTGAEVEGVIMPGGPCPPQHTILDCRPFQS